MPSPLLDFELEIITTNPDICIHFEKYWRVYTAIGKLIISLRYYKYLEIEQKQKPIYETFKRLEPRIRIRNLAVKTGHEFEALRKIILRFLWSLDDSAYSFRSFNEFTNSDKKRKWACDK